MVASDTQEQLNYLETAYDPWGRATSKRTYKDWPSQSQPITESYQYDISGNVIGYTDPMNHQNDAGVTTVYNYDALKRLTSVQTRLIRPPGIRMMALARSPKLRFKPKVARNKR
ncbi:RHS Repeat protein [compost metagenome]